MRKIHLLLGLAVLLTLVVAGCGGDSTTDNGMGDGTLAADTIGAAGGNIEVTGEFSLDVPPGALDTDVAFTVERNGSPGAEPTGYGYASDVYTFSPDGQTFLTPVSLTLDYDPAELGAWPEDSVRVWCRETGGDWTPLPSVVNAAGDQVTGQVAHFTDFAAMAPESDLPGDGVFCALSVDKGIIAYPGGGGPPTLLISDVISARFDGDVAPCDPSDPLQVDSVSCNTWGLEWQSETSRYVHMDDMYEEFIVLGDDYTFTVDGGATAPDLEETITFPADAPYVTSPQTYDTVDLSAGVTVEWADDGDGTVFLTVQSGLTVHTVEVPNNGSHTFTAGDLSAFSPGMAAIVLNHYNRRYLTVVGYHPESFIVAKVTNATQVFLE